MIFSIEVNVNKMKIKFFLILSVALFCLNSHSQQRGGGRIAYVDMEYILENVEEYREAKEQLEARVQKWKLEIEQDKNVIDQMKTDLIAEKVLLTPELIAEREEEIKILEKELFEYQQNRFGPEGDLILSKERLMQPIQDQVFNEVQVIGESRNYDLIFDRSADVVMLYAQKKLDLSELVLRAISRTRKVSAANKKEDKKNALDDYEEEPEEREMSDALKERKSQAELAQEAREKAATEKREEQLKLREERKNAYEERRNKLLSEREAKRKAAEENGSNNQQK